MSNTSATPIPRGYSPEEANQLEEAIRAYGLNPMDPAHYPIWTAWEKNGLQAALDLLTTQQQHVEGESMAPPNRSRLAQLRERVETLRKERQAKIAEGEPLHARWKECTNIMRTSTDALALRAAERELILIRNRENELIQQDRQILIQLSAAENAYNTAALQVQNAQRNLQRLTHQTDWKQGAIKLAPGDIRRLKIANQAILDTYGVSETEEITRL